jgi:hypothetical protein
MTTRLAIIVLVAAVASGAQAKKSDSVGALGWNDGLTLTLLGGYFTTQVHTVDDSTTPPTTDDYRLSGQLFMLRLQGGWYVGQTRFRSLMGAEFSLALGGFTPAALGRDAEERKKVTLRNFYCDFDAGLNIAILRWGTERHIFGGRFSLLGGAGLSSDLAYLYAGARLVIMLYPDVIHVEAAYKILPVTYGWSGGDTLEHRPSGTIVFDLNKQMRLGVGAEVWLGKLTKGDDAAPLSRGFKGDYKLYLGTLSIRWK